MQILWKYHCLKANRTDTEDKTRKRKTLPRFNQGERPSPPPRHQLLPRVDTCTHLQINQASSRLVLTLVRLLGTKGIVACLTKRTSSKPVNTSRSGLCWYHSILLSESTGCGLLLWPTCELLTEERVVAGLRCVQSVQPLTGASDKSSGRGVLRRDSEVAGVTKSVHTFTRCE